MTPKKKLIEVALPLVAINDESSRRKRKAPGGYPTTLHKWWAQRPLAAARAVIFAQMVDDPSAHPDLFPTEKEQEKERQRLFRIIEDLVKWENTTNEKVLEAARGEIWQSWRYTCAENADHEHADELLDRYQLPPFYDPFAGSGALPLEAQRLGLEAHASDLNPVAVLITKAMIEIPPKFAGWPPVNPDARTAAELATRKWKGAEGLAEDVRYYGKWMRNLAEERIGHLYPEAEVTSELVAERPDLKQYEGRKLNVIAWLWARTVRSPSPAFREVEVPVASTFMLSTRKGKETYVEPILEGSGYRFSVRIGEPKDPKAVRKGTRLARGSFRCLVSGDPILYEYIDDEANAGRMGQRLMAIVAEGDRGRVYLPPSRFMETAAREAKPHWKPETPSRGTWGSNAQGRRYGFVTFGDYFTPRQLVAVTTFSNLVQEVGERVKEDALLSGITDDFHTPVAAGSGAIGYAAAVSLYLAFAVSRAADYGSSMSMVSIMDGAPVALIDGVDCKEMTG